MSRFNLDLREAKPKFPQFFLNHGRDNPHHESTVVVEVPETSVKPTQSFHQMGALRKLALCYVLSP